MSERELLECPYCGKKFYDNCNPLEQQLAASQAREAELRQAGIKLLMVVLPPNDISGKAMYDDAARTIRGQSDG